MDNKIALPIIEASARIESVPKVVVRCGTLMPYISFDEFNL